MMQLPMPEVTLRVDPDLEEVAPLVKVSSDAQDMLHVEDGLVALHAETAADEVLGRPTKFGLPQIEKAMGDAQASRAEQPSCVIFCPVDEARVMAAGVRLVAERLTAQRAIVGGWESPILKREARFRALVAQFAVLDQVAER